MSLAEIFPGGPGFPRLGSSTIIGKRGKGELVVLESNLWRSSVHGTRHLHIKELFWILSGSFSQRDKFDNTHKTLTLTRSAVRSDWKLNWDPARLHSPMKECNSLALNLEDNSHDTSQSDDALKGKPWLLTATFRMEYAPVQWKPSAVYVCNSLLVLSLFF